MKYSELKRQSKIEFEKYASCSWELSLTADLKGKAKSHLTSLLDVKESTECSTIYAIEILKPDNTTAIYEGLYGQPLFFRPGTGVKLDYSGTIGIVQSIKSLYTGKIVKFADKNYDQFISFARIK